MPQPRTSLSVNDLIQKNAKHYTKTISQDIVPAKTRSVVFIPNFLTNPNSKSQNHTGHNGQEETTIQHNCTTDHNMLILVYFI